MTPIRHLITPRGLTALLLAGLIGWGVWLSGSMGLLAQTGPETGPEPIPESIVVYADVNPDAYYYDAVDMLASNGVFDGTDCDDDQFCPGNPLKRSQMAVWLIRALDETAPNPASQTRFDDVSTNDWWMPYVERLADLRITTGCSSDPPRYCPDNNVTRGQMASFLTRALDLPPAEPAGFTDVNSGNVHRDNINRLAAAKITTGCKSEPRRYCSSSSVTKAQMSAFIYRSLDWLEENRPDEVSTTAPTPKLISNNTNAFITQENDLSRYVKKNVIEQYEDEQPWLRDVWNHTNRADFAYLVGNRYGTATYYGNRLDEGESLVRSTAVAVTANTTQLSRIYDRAYVHELAHVYTKSNRIVANPAPIAAGHLYFSEITQGGECQSHELYAETAEALIFSRHISRENWALCPKVPRSITDEAVEVVGQAFSGRIPQWFYDTFYDSDNNPNLRAIWVAVGRIEDGQSRLAVVNQLRYSFGGYCSEANVWEQFSSHNYGPGQPWVDGGC